MEDEKERLLDIREEDKPKPKAEAGLFFKEYEEFKKNLREKKFPDTAIKITFEYMYEPVEIWEKLKKSLKDSGFEIELKRVPCLGELEEIDKAVQLKLDNVSKSLRWRKAGGILLPIASALLFVGGHYTDDNTSTGLCITGTVSTIITVCYYCCCLSNNESHSISINWGRRDMLKKLKADIEVYKVFVEKNPAESKEVGGCELIKIVDDCITRQLNGMLGRQIDKELKGGPTTWLSP